MPYALAAVEWYACHDMHSAGMKVRLYMCRHYVPLLLDVDASIGPHQP